MSEHGIPPPQRPRQPPPQHNAYDYTPPPYQPPYGIRQAPARYEVDPNRLYISIAKAVGIAVPLVLGLLYANNMLKDFQRETQIYQQNISEKMSQMVQSMHDMTTSRDLSDFCIAAQQENPTWKCPAVFQWRRRSGDGASYVPVGRDRRGVTTIQLGER